MVNNFIDKETGEEFFFSSFSIGFKGATPIYKGKDGKALMNPSNGNQLTLIPKKVDNYKGVAFFQAEGDRYKKTSSHFKKRAEKHNKSDEVRELRHKSMTNQLGTDYANVDRALRDKANKKQK